MLIRMLACFTGLFAEAPGDGAAAGGGDGATQAAAGDGKPAAGAPAGAQKADDGQGKPAAGAAESVATLEPVIGEGEPAAVTVEDQRKYLVEKGGKADEIAKLTDADLKTQFDAKKAEEVKPAAAAGELEITPPEGMKLEDLDQAELGKFKEIMLDDKLSPSERASKLVAMHATQLRAAAEQPMQLWFKTQKEWQDKVNADTEIGGAALSQNRANMSKAITDIMGDQATETFEALKFTGAANHPAIVRLIARMSKAFVEGSLTAGAAPGTAKRGTAASIAAMYPSASNHQPG